MAVPGPTRSVPIPISCAHKISSRMMALKFSTAIFGMLQPFNPDSLMQRQFPEAASDRRGRQMPADHGVFAAVPTLLSGGSRSLAGGAAGGSYHAAFGTHTFSAG